MTPEETVEIDRVFKALGHVTRRKILQLLAHTPRYPYELSKLLDLNRRVVLKHLESLEDAGLVGHEPGSSEMGPDRVYYRVNMAFGLSTAVMPNSFFVRVTRTGDADSTTVPRGIILSETDADVKAVKPLLNELGRLNEQLEKLDEERLRLVSLRGQIISRIENIMSDRNWDQRVCQRIRAIVDPVRADLPEADADELVLWSKAMDEVMSVFESMMGRRGTHTGKFAYQTEDQNE